MTKRRPIGHSDRHGTPIHEGDVVTYYFSADAYLETGCGHSATPAPGYSLMRDRVEIEEDGTAYFVADDGSGAFAWRYAAVCEIVGVHPSAIIPERTHD